MNLYTDDLKNLEKRSEIRSRWMVVDLVIFYTTILITLSVFQLFIGFWWSLIPLIPVTYLSQRYVTPAIEKRVDKVCRETFPMSYELSQTKTEEIPD